MNTKELLESYYNFLLHKNAQRYAKAYFEGNEIKYPHQKNYLTEVDLEKGIAGEITLGVMLIQDKTGLVKAGAIDIDVTRDAEDLVQAYELAKNIQNQALKHNINLEIEYSGNRGYHLWLFAETPITAKLMQECLKVISELSNFSANEIFPNAIPESKCIKLPGMTHLKSNNRSGFIGSNYNPNEPNILPNQYEVMTSLQKTAIEDIARVANLIQSAKPENNNSDSEVNITEIAETLKSFGSEHPSCINHLLNKGAPEEIEYNSSNLTLVRYCLTKGLNIEQSLPLAELMAKNTSDSHPTSKDYQARVSNFKSAFNSAKPLSYIFKCSYVLSNIKGKPLSSRGCIGSKCIACDFKEDLEKKALVNQHQNNQNWSFKQNSSNQNGSYTQHQSNQYGSFSQNSSNQNWGYTQHSSNQFSNDKTYSSNKNKATNQDSNFNSTGKENNHPEAQIKPYNSLIFRVMGKLMSEGKEASKSQILSECEKELRNLEEFEDLPIPPEGETLKEKEAIAFLLTNKEAIYDYTDLPEQGFISGSDKSIADYLEELFKLSLPSHDTIALHFEEIRERGIKILSTKKLELTKLDLIDEEKKVEVTLDDLIQDSEKLLKRSIGDKELKRVAYFIPDFTEELFSYELLAIKSPSSHLNNILNGGFQPGKLYVIGAPPGNGKSTFCSQCGDFAAKNKINVVYASYEMSRNQMIIASLARIEGLNSAVIEGKKFLDEQYKAKDTLVERVMSAIDKYSADISDNLTIIEADYDYTAYKLKAICKKLDTDLLIIDYLQLLSSGDQRLDNAYQETLRVSKIATELKRLARETNTAVIAISDVNKDAYNKAITGGDLDMGALRDSFKIAHSADVILLLQSQAVIIGKGETKTKYDQLDLLAKKYPEKQRQIDALKSKNPLNKKTADTYARITIVKNRGGKLGEPVFLYSRALHDFKPLDFEVEIDPDEQDI
jgi:replicative DNA helicase